MFLVAVPAQHDALTDPQRRASVGGWVVVGEFAGTDEMVDRGLVQPVDEFVGSGEQDRVEAGCSCFGPEGDGVGDEIGRCCGDGEPVVFDVGANG